MRYPTAQRNSLISTCFALILILLVVAGTAIAHQEATSELLLPYFEVDLDGGGVTTFLSVTNSSSNPVEAEVILYTNWGIEVFATTIAIDGDAVFQADLRRWLVAGNVPGKALGAGELAHIQAAFTGQASPTNGLYYATEVTFNLAVGYVKIRLDGLPAERDILFGEYFIVDDMQGLAQGDVLIPISQGEACPGLCARHGIRFLAGGSFDSGTEIVIWSAVRGEPSENAAFPAEMSRADVLVYREDGTRVGQLTLGFLPLQLVEVSELGLSTPFGWLDLLSERNTLVTLRLSASNRFSVGFRTSCLPRQADTPDDIPQPQAHLRLIKHVINGDTGVLRPNDFGLRIGNRRVRSGEGVALVPGTYVVRESRDEGYTTRGWGGDCAADGTDKTIGTVTLEAGDNKICEITNDDKSDPPGPPTLTLVKHVVGGPFGGFALFVNDQQVMSGEVNTFAPGTYTAREITTSDYVPGPWTGDCAADGTVTLAAGEHKVCEITNAYASPPPWPALYLSADSLR